MKLAEYLEKTNTPHGEFAKAMKVTPGCISHWMKGTTKPNTDKAREILAYTGGRVTLHEIRPDVWNKLDD